MGFFCVPDRSMRMYGYRVTAGLRVRKERRTHKMMYQMEIRVGMAICAGAGFSVGDRVELRWGHGPDFGWICLVKSTKGTTLRTSTHQTKSLVVTSNSVAMNEISDEHSGVWKLRLEAHGMGEVKHSQLPEGRLGIELPREWFEQIKAPKKFMVVG